MTSRHAHCPHCNSAEGGQDMTEGHLRCSSCGAYFWSDGRPCDAHGVTSEPPAAPGRVPNPDGPATYNTGLGGAVVS